MLARLLFSSLFFFFLCATISVAGLARLQLATRIAMENLILNNILLLVAQRRATRYKWHTTSQTAATTAAPY